MSKLFPLPCNSPSSAWSQFTCPWALLQGRISTSISATPGLPETSICVQITLSSYSLQRRGQFLTSTSTFIDTCQPSGGLYWVDHKSLTMILCLFLFILFLICLKEMLVYTWWMQKLECYQTSLYLICSSSDLPLAPQLSRNPTLPMTR